MKIPAARLLLLLLQQERDQSAQNKLIEVFLRGGHEAIHTTLETYQDKLIDIGWDRSYEAINNDPVRRYFESQLARLTLKNHLDNLPENTLDNLLDQIQSGIPSYLQAEYKADLVDHPENSDALRRINSPYESYNRHGYESFSPEQRKKLEKCWHITTAMLLYGDNKHYDSNINALLDTPSFTSQRGRQKKEPKKETVSHALGIMRYDMPLDKKDLLYVDDIFYSHKADENDYIETETIQTQFALGVQPFSGALSGHLLTLLNIIAAIINKNKKNEEKKDIALPAFLRIWICALLFNSGGHSFYEFLQILSFSAIRDFFVTTHPVFSKITNDPWYLLTIDNTPAIQQALSLTQCYHKHYFPGEYATIVSIPSIRTTPGLTYFSHSLSSPLEPETRSSLEIKNPKIH